jgi:hypothetical protein
MHKTTMLKLAPLFILLILISNLMSGCITETSSPSSMSVKVSVYVSGGNETISPQEKVVTINKSSIQTVEFTLYSPEPRDYSQIAISINVSGIQDPIICPKNFSNYERNQSGGIVNFTETKNINVMLKTVEILPEDMQTVTVYYSSKSPTT